MEGRNLLHRIDLDKGTILLEGGEQEMLDSHFPTMDPADPYRLTAEENAIMERLAAAFQNCEKLQQHTLLLTLARKKFVELGKEGLPCLPAF